MNLKIYCPHCGKKLINLNNNVNLYESYYCDDCRVEIVVTNAYHTIVSIDVEPEN